LHNLCPNCGGGFVPRPVRPANKLANNPASNVAVVKPVDLDQHQAVSLALRDIPAEKRYGVNQSGAKLRFSTTVICGNSGAGKNTDANKLAASQ
jgi:putative ribosome biogenesis GTPase RsgA